MSGSESSEDEAAALPAPSTVPMKFRLAESQRKDRKAFNPMKNVLINSSLCKYSAVRKAADSRGFQEAEEGRENWHMFWTDLSVSHARVKALTQIQRINHCMHMHILHATLVSLHVVADPWLCAPDLVQSPTCAESATRPILPSC